MNNPQSYTIGRCPDCGWTDAELDVCWSDTCKMATPCEPFEVVSKADHDDLLGKLQRATDALDKIAASQSWTGDIARDVLADLRPEENTGTGLDFGPYKREEPS